MKRDPRWADSTVIATPHIPRVNYSGMWKKLSLERPGIAGEYGKIPKARTWDEGEIIRTRPRLRANQ